MPTLVFQIVLSVRGGAECLRMAGISVWALKGLAAGVAGLVVGGREPRGAIAGPEVGGGEPRGTIMGLGVGGREPRGTVLKPKLFKGR
jgi:hypothetical protein